MFLAKGCKLLADGSDFLANATLFIDSCRDFLFGTANLLLNRIEFVFRLCGVDLDLRPI